MQITRFALASLLTLPFGGLAHAATWVVDDNPGPGVDFTTIDAAIAVAAPNDVIVVRAGNYAPFTLNRALVLLGDSGSTVSQGTNIVNIPVGERAAVTGLTLNGLGISACDGAVFLDGLTIKVAVMKVSTCRDVRARRLDIDRPSIFTQDSMPHAALVVDASRVELVESRVAGGCDCIGYIDGLDAVSVDHGSEIHVSRTRLIGGDGGTLLSCTFGFGGSGLWIRTASTAHVSGLPTDLIARGAGSVSFPCGTFGPDGNTIMPFGAGLRISGVSLVGNPQYSALVTAEQPTLADPVMKLNETPLPGGTLTFSIDAPPGSTVDFVAGRRPQVSVVPGLQEDVLTYPDRLLHVGVVDGTGVKTVVFAVPASFPQGMTFVTQAEVTYPDLSVRRTHSIPIILR